MKKIINLISIFILTLCVFLAIGGGKVQAASTNKVIKYIVTTPGEDPSSEITINYECFEKGSYFEYTLKDDVNFENAIKVTPNEELWSLNGIAKADTADSFYKVARYSCHYTLTGLSPRTSYIYRVVSGSVVSDVFNFTTAGLTNSWTFAAFADFQNWNNTISHPLIQRVRALAGNAPLVLCTGDMTDTSGHEEEWDWLLENEVWKDFVFAASPGDHEYWAKYDNGSINYAMPYAYNSILSFPKNGAAESLNSNYYFIYNNVLFISIDTLDSDTVRNAKMTAEIAWFKETVERLEGKYQYIVVMQHKSIYGSVAHDSRVSTEIRGQWSGVFDQYNVDLVLSGHDHTYHRTHKMVGGEPVQDTGKNKFKGVYYCDIGTSGNKRYDLDKGQENDPLFAVTYDYPSLGISCGAAIEVTDTHMTVNVYDNYGNLRDQFTIAAKRQATPVSTDGFNEEELLNDVSLDVTNVTTGKGVLKFETGKMLKYVSNVEILDGEEVVYSFIPNVGSSLEFTVTNLHKTDYDVRFTIGDKSTYTKHLGLDYFATADIKTEMISDGIPALNITWNTDMGNISGYTWRIMVDGVNLDEIKLATIKKGMYELPNKYLLGDHDISIDLLVSDEAIDSYAFVYHGATASLEKDQLTLSKKQTSNLMLNFPYEDLVEVSISDTNVIAYNNGVITALNKGVSTITFKIYDTNIKYTCTVTVTGGGCGGNVGTLIIGVTSLLGLAYLFRKQY